MQAISETNFQFPQQTSFYRGKVRDVYRFGTLMALVVSDRISAFDVVLPEPIPYKGQILNKIALNNLAKTLDIVPNWILESPHPQVSIGYYCKPYPVEMVIRGYLAGHAWRVYQAGGRMLCGVNLPEGLKENDRLPSPIITPSTKAQEGHDEDISAEAIIAQGLVSEEEYRKIESYTYQLYNRGKKLAQERGLILVDTKYEFGKTEAEQIVLIDEIHTPDSSRYFYEASYEENQSAGLSQKQLSKEFVRQWLIENGFQGKDGQKIPEMTKEVVQGISNRYIELYNQITGETFVKENPSNLTEIETSISQSIQKLQSKINQ